MTETVDVPREIADVPSSAKLVYLVLRHEGPCSRGDIRKLVGMSDREMDGALGHLRDLELVEETPVTVDGRKNEYQLAE